MRKVFLTICIVISICISSSWLPRKSLALEETADYLIFFQNSTDMQNALTWINQFQRWDHHYETTMFPQLSVCQLKASPDTFRLIRKHFPSITMVPNYRFSAAPVYRKEVQNTIDSTIPWNLESIQANWLWEQGFTGKGIHLGILDTGADGTHKDLKDKIRNFVFVDRSGLVMRENTAYDTDTHGTHVSGIIAGGSAEKPLGISPNSTLSVGVVIPGGGGSFVQILAGLEWIMDPDQNPSTDDTPRAVNLSLGAPGYLTIWSSILNKLLNKNILPVFSVGNDGDGITSTPGNTPLSCSVGALDSQNRVATFSSGADHLNWEDEECQQLDYTKPDVSAPGVDVVSSVPGNKYEAMSGSSMAAPHLTGAVGLLSEAFPDISAYDLRAYIENTSTDLGASGPDSRYGKGKLNLKNTYLKLSNAIKVTGQITHQDKATLLWRELNRPVYVAPTGHFVSYLEPGSYHLDYYINQQLVYTIPVMNLEKTIHLTAELPLIEASYTEGRVLNNKGNPLSATIFSSQESVQTDAEGYFRIRSSSFESLEIYASGYQDSMMPVQRSKSFINVRLKPAGILLIEGNSMMNTVKHPPRNIKRYYTDTLSDLGLSYAFFHSGKHTLTWEFIKDFDVVIAFYPSGTVTYEESKVLSRYLEAGGRLILSGRLLLYLEQYIGNDFLQSYYGITSRYTIANPSVTSYPENGPFANFFFPLSGDGGANNQEYCEILQKNESGKSFTPLLRYSDTSKDTYAAISLSNGHYRSILMGFGFEGIGQPSSRYEWMKAMLTWIRADRLVHVRFNETKSPHFIRIKKNNQSIVEQITLQNDVTYRNLEPGDYEIMLHTYGYESETFKTSIQSGDYLSIQSFPKTSTKQSVDLHFSLPDDNVIYTQLYFYSELIQETILTDRSLITDLPAGSYTLLAYTSSMTPLRYNITVNDQPIKLNLDFSPMKKKVLLINDSATGNIFLDNYIRLGDFYNKYFTSISVGVDYWDVVSKGFPTKLDLLPYQAIYYFTGVNQNALVNPEHLSVIGFFLDQGGKAIFNGNCHHANLKNTSFLKQYFGIDIYSTNVREQTVIGSKDTVMKGMTIDLFDSMIDNGILTPYPSLTLLDEKVIPVFSYVSGKPSSSFYEKDSFRTLYITFGLDNLTKTNTRLELVSKSIQMVLDGNHPGK